jgi:hypothetical protein
VVEHLFERDRQRGVEAQHNHAHRVANQQHVDPCKIDVDGRRIIVRSAHGDGHEVVAHFLEVNNGDVLAPVYSLLEIGDRTLCHARHLSWR